MSEDLASRVARLEARAEIEELVARYTLHAAAAEVEALAGLFTVDGVFHARSGSVRGQAPLVEFFARSLNPGTTVPIAGQIHVRFASAERATLKCLMATTFSDGKPGGFCGHYDDELEREGGEWKFASRNFTFYHAV